MEVLSLVTSIDFDLSSSAYPKTQPIPFRATVPFAWENKPGVTNPFYEFLEQDFTFDVSGAFSSDSVPAEELFDGGVIKHSEMKTGSSSFSSFSGLPISKRRTQSFSTDRGWEFPWEEHEEKAKRLSPKTKDIKPQLVSSFSSRSASSSVKRSRKWCFKNLFLFRSASDGFAMNRDPLKKYSSMFRKRDADFKNSSFKSIKHGKHGSGSGSGSKRRELVSAHELNYKINREVANDMKRRTFLPYKQGILGRSAFNPSVHAHSNVFGSSHHNI